MTNDELKELRQIKKEYEVFKEIYKIRFTEQGLDVMLKHVKDIIKTAEQLEKEDQNET